MHDTRRLKARIIAFYLPQFHPIPENDEWWGKGFTEWTNVGKAKPLFRGHYQPRVPADLGYYDLRLHEVRQAQAEMARNAGVEGFAYWHYWWEGKTLLERPFNEVLKTGKPDYPFCIAWANETWSGIWIGNPGRVLMKQTYPGKDDYEKHFYHILEALHDSRYIHVDGKPLFYVYKPLQIPDTKLFMDTWNNLAIKNGLSGIHFVGLATRKQVNDVLSLGYDGVNIYEFYEAIDAIEGQFIHKVKNNLIEKVGGLILNRYDYGAIIKNFYSKRGCDENIYPTILPQWDNSPRSGRRSVILTASTPDKFKTHVREAVTIVQKKRDEHRIIFLKSWNEWAEGNYVEPDIQYGHGYLNALRETIVEE